MDPTNPFAALCLAESWEKGGDTDGALLAYFQAITLALNHASVHAFSMLGAKHIGSGDRKRKKTFPDLKLRHYRPFSAAAAFAAVC